MFVCAILFSVIPEYLPVFGDWECTGSGNYIHVSFSSHYERCNYASRNYHDACTHWGYRHWLLCLMGISLFILQLAGLIIYIDRTAIK